MSKQFPFANRIAADWLICINKMPASILKRLNSKSAFKLTLLCNTNPTCCRRQFLSEITQHQTTRGTGALYKRLVLVLVLVLALYAILPISYFKRYCDPKCLLFIFLNIDKLYLYKFSILIILNIRGIVI